MPENDSVKKCCFTGYRPAKLPFNINIKNADYIAFENALIEQIIELTNNNCYIFYSGMAIGFDIIAAETVLFVKKSLNLPLKLICAIPFENQADGFNEEWRKRYDEVLKQSDETIIICEKYSKYCYQKRNEFMVNSSDYVLTWYDGKPGGTKNTIDYAIKKGRFILNINSKSNADYATQTYIEII